MSDAVYLDEVKLVVQNFVEKYGGDWEMLKADVDSIRRTDEEETDEDGNYTTATAKVHLVVKDEVVIGELASYNSKNLWKVTAMCASEVGHSAFYCCENLIEAILPSVNSVGEYSFTYCSKLTNGRLPNATSIRMYAFGHCYALRHITVHPNVNIPKYAFYRSLSLEVLATCAGFELDTGDKTPGGHLDPTVAITRYLKLQCELDRQQSDVFLTYNLMLKLCNHHIDKETGVIRATPQEQDRLANFLLDNEDLASHILSFFGIKWGEKDLRNASKQRILELEL